MRWRISSVVLAGCVGHPAATTAPPVEPQVAALAVAATVPLQPSPKLSPTIAQWRDHGLPAGEYTPILITTRAPLDATQRDLLDGLGAEDVRAVVARPDTRGAAAGTLAATATDGPSSTVIAIVPNDAFRFLVAQDWVIRLDAPSSYPIVFPSAIQARLDPRLMTELRRYGRHRRYAVGAIAKISGCLDDAKRAALVATGVILGSVLPDHSCRHTIVTFEIPLSRVVSMASLPWVTKIEAGGRIAPD